MTALNETNIRMPEGRMIITAEGQGGKTSSKERSTANTQPEKQNGFEALSALVGLSTGLFLYRRKAN